MDGVVNINKPRGWSSFDVVKKIKDLSGISKVGHAGTLDPEAEGVLIVLLGEACKASELFMKKSKTYLGTIVLGYKSDTLDSAGIIEKIEDAKYSKIEVASAIRKFKGEYIHCVPEFSAKKYKGTTFYKIKRNGSTPPKRLQNSHIFDIKLIDYIPPEIKLSITCSSGTYIRALAVDIADKLGTTGYIKYLNRTRVNGFMVEKAVAPGKETWIKGFVDIGEALLKYPHIIVENKVAEKIFYGVNFSGKDVVKINGNIEETIFGVYSSVFNLKALAQKDADGNFKLRRVFNIL